MPNEIALPAITIPVSLIGSFAVLYSLGYSLNTVTLFGLVLAVGIVVDDAIIVVENVQRQIQENQRPITEAVIAAMKEVTGPVIATTLVLLAVFFPIGFIPGTAGHFYREFGMATSSAVLISSICALTLSPVMCLGLMAKQKNNSTGAIGHLANRLFAWVIKIYLIGVAFFLKRSYLVLFFVVAISALLFGLYQKIPSSFVPADDRVFFISVCSYQTVTP